MTISLVGTFGATASTGAVDVTLPTGISLGDAVGVVVIGSTTPTLTAPAGWTLRSGWPKTGGNAQLWAYTKDSVTAGDSATTHSFTPSTTTKLVAVGFALHSSNGFPADWTDQLNFTAHTTTSATYTAPSSTSTAAGDYGLAVFGTRGTGPHGDWAPAAGLVERQDLTHSGSGATTLQLCDSGGSIGAAATVWGPFTESNTSTANGGALTWLVKENATGGGGGGGGGGGLLYPKLGHYRGRTGLSWRQAQDQAETLYGTFQGHWGHYDGVGSAPLGADTTQAITDGKRVHLFWKAYDISWADTAAGGYDAEIDGFAADIVALAPTPGQVWISVHHEPEDDYINNGSGGVGWTASDYRGMWNRVVSRFVTAGADQYVTWVCAFQHFESHPAEMITLWGSDGVMDGLVDVVACQPYIGPTTTPTNLATRYLDNLEWLRTNEAAGRNWGYLKKPQAITETGADINAPRGTDTHRAQAIDGIRAALADLASRNLLEIRWFDFGATEYINDPPSVDGVAYQALKAASEAGQTVGPVAAAGVALARDGATGTSATIPFTLPTGWAQGDYATAWLVTNGVPDVSAVPAGWTLQEGPVTTGASNGRAWRYAKVLQAGEANPTWTLSTAERPSGVLVLLRGADEATPVVASAALVAVAPGTSLAAAAVTVPGGATATVLTVWLARWSDASGNGGVAYGSAPGTHTTLGSASVNSGASAGSGGLVAQLAASPVGPGSYGPYSSTWPITVTGITGQLAILPASAPPPPPGTVFGAATATFGFVATAAGVTVPAAAAALVPDASVRVAWSTAPMDPAPAFTSLPVLGPNAVQAPITCTHGRPDEFADVTPGTCGADLRNEDGRYTLGKTTGPYGTNVLPGKRVRVSYTYQGTGYDRHDGHANGWPTGFPIGGGAYATGGLSSTDRLKRLGEIGELRSMLEEETLADGPAAYWPLGEGENAVSAGSVTPVPQAAAVVRQVGGGGLVELGRGTGPGTDGLPAVVFTPTSTTAGAYLAAHPVAAGTDDAATLECWFATTQAPSPPMALCALTTPIGGEALILTVDGAGRVGAHYLAGSGGTFANTTPQTSWHDGRTHHAAVTLARNAGTGVVTVRLYVDGTQRLSGTFSRGPLAKFTQVDVGGFHVKGAFGPYSGTLSHVAAYSATLPAARVATHWHAGADGLAGERTSERIARVADWIGLPAGERLLDTGDKRMGAQACHGRSPLQVMQEAAQVEQGVLFCDGQGRLVFHRLGRRYNRTTPDLTLDCAQTGHVQVGLELPGDDFGLTNDMEVTRSGGGTQRARNQPSIDTYGLYRDSLEIPAASDSDAQAVANWRVNTDGTPRPRVPNLTINLAKLHQVSPSLVQQVLALEISSLVRLVNLPPQAPATSMDVFVEGWTEVIDPRGTWAITFNLSPADHYTVARVGTAKVGQSRVAL